MGVPCRWHIARIGVPNFRSKAVTTALVIVGAMLLETGAPAYTPIVSSVASAPIAAVTGPGDSLVAIADPRPVVSVVQAIGYGPSTGSGDGWSSAAMASRAGVPHFEGPDAALADPFAVDAVRALDPALRADLPVAAGAARVAAGGQVMTSAGLTLPRHDKKRRHRWNRTPGPWKVSRLVTWYGPGFYGNQTACGQRYTRHILGVAHRTLPCGTLVQFRWHGMTAVAPVIDRGPFGHKQLKFDWSAWLACRTFKPKRVDNGCFTREDVKYRVVGKVKLKQWFKERKAWKSKRDA